MALSNRILPSIYHEKQEPDSSLCAQHCLNNLIQDGIWTAADLADLARQLDQRELDARAEGGGIAPRAENTTQSGRARRQGDPDPIFDDDDDSEEQSDEARMRRINPHLNAGRSRNMDDSGFFSVQVMDEALKSFNLQLVRWRSNDLKSLQASPEKMEAFVLNLSSHWFAIRKFGKSKHFWYDLNSFHPQAKHVSPLYLGLQIDQAEHEGYSVFVVLPRPEEETTSAAGSSITTIFSLPHCRADDTVAELADEARTLINAKPPMPGLDPDIDDENLFESTGTGPSFTDAAYAGFGGAGNEDEELNRAIEASLAGYQAPTAAKSAREEKAATVPDFGEIDDPELAAAIAASLENSSAGGASSSVQSSTQGTATTSASARKTNQPREVFEDIEPPSPDSEGDAEMTTEAEEEEAEDDEEEERAPTAEELRLKRLARFGGA